MERAHVSKVRFQNILWKYEIFYKILIEIINEWIDILLIRQHWYTNVVEFVEKQFFFSHLFRLIFVFPHYFFEMSCLWGLYLAFYWIWHNQSMCYWQICIRTHMFSHTWNKLDMWSMFYVCYGALDFDHMWYKSLYRMTFSILSLLHITTTCISNEKKSNQKENQCKQDNIRW